MALGALHDESDLKQWLARELDGSALAILIRQLQAGPPTYTLATRPASANRPLIIYVSDAGAGARVQCWDATAGAWAPLG